MLYITVFQDTEGCIVALEAQGHTHCALKGQDIVCAGVSVLVQSAVLSFKEILGIKFPLDQEDGYLYFSLPEDISLEDMEKTQLILKTILLGLKEIKSQYKDSILISYEKINR